MPSPVKSLGRPHKIKKHKTQEFEGILADFLEYVKSLSALLRSVFSDNYVRWNCLIRAVISF